MKKTCLFALAFILMMPALVFGDPAVPVVAGSTATYGGDLSGGISVTSSTTPSSTTINTLILTGVDDSVVIPGVNYTYTGLGNVSASITSGSETESVEISTTGTHTSALSARTNGFWASGATSGGLTIKSYGEIETAGAESHGVEALSRGGTGPAGAEGHLTTDGGIGSTGQTSGAIAVTVEGSISTLQNDSSGVTALSAGGAGAQGGEAGLFSSAGRGGAGGTGGAVSVQGGATIATSGDYSSGIAAMSTGGSGGPGGEGYFLSGGESGGYGGLGGAVAVDGDWDIATTGEHALGIWAKSVGGNAGAGGAGGWASGSPGGGGLAANGGAVTLQSGGLVSTEGTASYGLHAQSVGGFGGAGATSSSLFLSFGGDASSGGSGGSVEVENAEGGKVVTQGEYSHAISAQSIGGGGGSGGGKFGLFTSLGGAGASGGNGGSVSVENQGRLETSGTGSFGVLAQSVGGGGGDGGSVSGLVGIGGTGSQTSDGGDVAVSNLGTILTHGLQSHGIFAESVGGGGGNGGRASGLISLGGSGGSGGDSGTVTVVNEGTIRTEEDESHGIFAQSVGGGGGSGGGAVSASALVSFAMGGKGTAGGDAEAVVVENLVDGTIVTEGDRSFGIFAQSLGGGGGDGGYSVTGCAGGIALSIGGSAGGGGDGGAVDVQVDGDIATSGERAYAVIAQSVGGGGGTGGFSVAGQIGGALSLGLGGTGGAGGRGAAVSVDITGTLATTGLGAHAVFAQSVGGGGGDGGFSIASSIGGPGGSPSANISVGGAGGTGSTGGNVVVNSSGIISTQADDAHGILAQSVGGSGGNGGYAISASVGGGIGLNLGFGGSGGTGSSAGTVTLGSAEKRLGGTISTLGDRSFGILAQSVGGGGGNGGATITGSLLSPAAITMGFGGSGGSGGLGKQVEVFTGAAIKTFGSQSHGILAQSVGGGGGSGGLSITGGVTAFGGLSLAMGGSGGSGNSGGLVRVANGGAIETSGEYSYGVFAQSVGGSGGAGGSSGAVMVNFSSLIPVPESYPTGSINIGLSLGGAGGSGGLGGEVHVDNAGTILTREDYSYGIMAQSVGGGGGDGGESVAATANISQPSTPEGGEAKPQVEVKVDFAVALGGNGGTGNNGGAVSVSNTGVIETLGDGSHGIFAQAIGGGGGSGGNARSMILSVDPSNWEPTDPPPDPDSYSFGATYSLGGKGGAAGNGGAVGVTNVGKIVTNGADAYGIIAQSVGGGGGISGSGYHGLDWQDLGLSEDMADALDMLPIEEEGQVHIALGGGGLSGGGAGGAVTVSNTGSILTKGGGSIGLLAQSIGGGGGIGGSGATGLEGSVTLGGSGGSGGAGGNILIDQEGSIETSGVAAHGILAQSVGGGGGIAGNADLGISATGIDQSIGAAGGAGGDGGSVTVASVGDIITRGDGAIGIIAQSVGGGGGIGGGIGDCYGFAGSVGKVGQGGSVEVNHTGSIVTFGKYAHGILAQSVGGVDFGGEVLVTVDGDIIVSGEGSVAVLGQSKGQAGAQKIDFVYQSGTIIGNSSGAVKFLDGTTNSFTNRGVVTTVGGPDGTAFLMADGDDIVRNLGLITGSVDLGGGANSFANQIGSTFNCGELIKLGLGALAELYNEGNLSPGGIGRALATELIGALKQTDIAKMVMELDMRTGLSDILEVSGIADLAGQLLIDLANPGFAADGSYLTTLISAAGGIIDQGLEFMSNPRAVMDYFLSFAPNGTDLLLELVIDLTPQGLSAAQGKIGDIINQIKIIGDAESFAPIAAKLFALADVEDLGSAYEQISDATSHFLFSLSSGETTDTYISTLVKRMHSVRSAVQGHARDMKVKQVLPNAVWMETFGLVAGQDSVGGASGYDPLMTGTTAGYDRLLSDGRLLGLSGGVAKADVDIRDSASRTMIDSCFGSLFGSLFSDKAYADAALSFGLHRYRSLRAVQIGTETLSAESEHYGYALSAYLESGYNLFLRDWLFEPYASLRFGRMDEDSYNETGLEGAGLRVDARTTQSLLTGLGLRLSRPFKYKAWTVLPEVKVAWHHDFPLGDRSVVASFQSAPSMTFTSEGADMQPDGLSAGFGLNLISKSHVSISAAYDGEFRSGYASHSLVAGIRYEF